MLRRTTHLLLVAFALIAPGGVARAQDRAQELLGQARHAAGIDAAAAPVTTFSAKAAVKTALPQMEVTADNDLEFILPDKYRKVMNISIAGMNIQTTTGVNANRLIYDDGGRAAAQGLDMKTGPLAQELLTASRCENLSLQTLLLLSLPPSFTASYAGEAEAPDGKADAVDVKGPENFVLRMFLDKQTHRVLMATYAIDSPDVNANQMIELQKKVTAENPGNPQAAIKAIQDFVAKAPRKRMTVSMRFSDYKKVGAVLFPHHMNIEREGPNQPSEDWTFSKFTLNPSLKAEKFETK